MNRREYLDWLRGVAVLIMVEAHLFDAWVRILDRSEPSYRWAIAVGGYSAPLFLFLAGVTTALATGSRLRKGLTTSEVAAIGRRRGWQPPSCGLRLCCRGCRVLLSDRRNRESGGCPKGSPVLPANGCGD